MPIYPTLTLDRALAIAHGQEPVDGIEYLAVAKKLADVVEAQSVLLTDARALHVPDGSHDCKSCNAHVTTGEPVKWPCPTATALGRPRLVMTVQWEPA